MLLHASCRLPWPMYWLRIRATSSDITLISVAHRSRKQASWKCKALSGLTSCLIWLIKGWWRQHEFTWREWTTKCWGDFWTAGGFTWVDICPDAPRACMFLPFLLYTRTTRFITWIHTWHTQCCLWCREGGRRTQTTMKCLHSHVGRWERVQLGDSQKRNGWYGLFCQHEAMEDICNSVLQHDALQPHSLWWGTGWYNVRGRWAVCERKKFQAYSVHISEGAEGSN